MANPLGPVGTTVQQNVKRLREEQNLTLAELSRRLSGDKIRRKIPTLALARIEKGERRVDADDLVALALALRVAPTTLLLPVVDPGEPIQLAEEFPVRWSQAWRWAHGQEPLPGSAEAATWTTRAQWLDQNRPYMSPRATIEELQRLLEAREVGVGPFRVELEHDGEHWTKAEMIQRGHRKEEDDGDPGS